MKIAKYCIFFMMNLTLLCAQGITTGEIRGKIVGQAHQPLENVSVVAEHIASGTKYAATTLVDGRYTLRYLRTGGPYRITASLVGFASSQYENVTVRLGDPDVVDFTLEDAAIRLQDVIVVSSPDFGINSERTGSTTSVRKEVLDVFPSVGRTISDYLRLVPEMKNNSFGGQDVRLNNFTVNGAYFNNSFGVGNIPGDRTGVAPISMDAMEEIRIAAAPFDIRQGNFTGAGIDMITKSGTNDFSGSLSYRMRNESFVGKKAATADFNPGTFDFSLLGVNASGPIIRDKLFFFVNAETEKDIRPGTSYRANNGNQMAGGNITRVLKSDLDALRNFLKSNFNYEAGAYDGYDFETPARRLILKFDYNPDEYNNLSLSYNHLDSKSDVMIANSASLGYGNRRGTIYSLNFENSNYSIVEEIRSLTAEWNAVWNDHLSNNLIVGYRHHNESRESPGKFFPFVDILKDDMVYTSFGTEPFTPYNGLTYGSLQLQNNLNWYLQSHTLLFGVCLERFESEDDFFPGAQSVYVYNSLDDFYADANDYLAHPDRTVSPVNLKKFQVRYSNLPGMAIPHPKLKVWYGSLYAQDEWNTTENVKLTLGLRVDVPFFENTGYKNAQVDGLTFKDEYGNDVRYSTDKMPGANPLYSFRLGFNWSALDDKSLIVRGGTGIFTGQPAFVWISNQVENNGILSGFESLTGSALSPLTSRPFNPDPDTYKPRDVSGQPAARYELALTDPDFKFPQVWRTTIGADYQLPWDLVSTLDFTYGRDINGVYYINANLSRPDAVYTGADNRPRWTTGNRIYPNIDDAVVLKNQNAGYSWNIAASLERQFRNGFYGKVGYSCGKAMNTVDASTVAYVSWYYNTQSGNPNSPGVSYSMFTPDQRFFTALSYTFDYFNFGSTTFSTFLEASTVGRASYTYSGDFNGDGVYNNDLIYVPRDKSEMYFTAYTSGGITFTADEQKDAWEKYIEQDKYLKSRRGKYAERNGVVLPLLTRMDVSINQEFHASLFGKRNSFGIRLDIMNFTNLLKSTWGVAQQLQTNTPLIAQAPDAQGRPVYTLRAINNKLIDHSFTNTATLYDVYRMQLTLRWML